MIYDLIIAIVLSIIFSLVFVYSRNKTCENIKNENYIYLNSDIDYQIPNPSVDQLQEIKEKSFVEDTFGYYLTKVSVKGDKIANINLLMSNTMQSLSFTMYNEKTKLSSIANTFNFAYIDKKAAEMLNVKCGDEISVKIANTDLKYIVCAIYQANPLFSDGSVLVQFSGDIKKVYEANVSSKGYSGAFINASNEVECSNYLNDYIPMGRLKDRSEFDSDEAYNIYNNSIMNANYLNEISKFANSRNIAIKELYEAEKERDTYIYIGGVSIGICWILMSFILRNRKSENKLFKEIIKNKKNIKNYRIFTFIFGTVIYFIVTIIFQYILSTLSLTIFPILISVALFVISYILNCELDKKCIEIR